MEDFHFAGGLPGFLSRITDLLHLDRPTVAHDTLREQLDGRASSTTTTSSAPATTRSPTRAGSRSCAATSAPTAPSSSTSPPSRTCSGTPAPRSSSTTTRTMQRTINDPALDITAGQRAGAAQRRPQGRPRHARVRHAADPRPPAQAGRAGHGADLRRPDERHELRRLRAAHRARVVRRRTARPGPHRRPHHPGRRGARRSISTWTTRSWSGAGRTWTPPPARYERGYGALYNEQITQADTGCDFEFLARPGKVPDPYAG